MGKWIHRLTEKSEDGTTAVCDHCGPVRVSFGKCINKKNELSRQTKYRKKYGIEIKDMQIGNCGICGGNTRIAYDHDHKTGEFRGWLCIKCNTALGLVNDDVEILQKLIDYLER